MYTWYQLNIDDYENSFIQHHLQDNFKTEFHKIFWDTEVWWNDGVFLKYVFQTTICLTIETIE